MVPTELSILNDYALYKSTHSLTQCDRMADDTQELETTVGTGVEPRQTPLDASNFLVMPWRKLHACCCKGQ